jgi:hypothetical protein
VTSACFSPAITGPKNLHLWLHDVTQAVYRDTLIRPFATSPRSTYFYNFHGLIQNWRLDVERAMRSPRMVDWEQLLAGERLYDNDVITAVITPNAMSPGPNGEAAVDFVLTSTLWWGKWINVPDGEGTGANWTISTGAPWFGGRKTVDSVALWAHQVHNGQLEGGLHMGRGLTILVAIVIGQRSRQNFPNTLEPFMPADRDAWAASAIDRIGALFARFAQHQCRHAKTRSTPVLI